MEKINEITKNIIKESIKNVICIDDEFLQPYSKNSELENNNIAKELYESFSGEYNCLLDIVKYTSQNQCISKFSNKDLLILDWELVQDEPKFSEALNILEAATVSDIPFICIYTHSPEIEDIYNVIYCYFLGYCKNDIKEIPDIIYNNDLDDVINDFQDDIKDYVISNNNKNSYKALMKKLYGRYSPEERQNLPFTSPQFIEKLYLNQANRFIPDYVEYNFKAEKILHKKETIALNLNGKILIVIKKRKKEDETSVIAKPSELLNKFSENIVKEPNNIFNIIWLQYKNYFNRVLGRPVDFFQDINENAFLHHNKQLVSNSHEIEKNNVFDNFIKGFYKDELISKLNSQSMVTPVEIIDYINNKDYEEPDAKDLLKLNYYYSVNKNISNKDRKIQFGDIFKCNLNNELTNKYVICVTAHCDCLRPEKIYNIYYFVLGEKTSKISTTLKNPEQDGVHYSFIKEDDEYICIKWENGIFPLFIEDCNIRSDLVNIIFKNNNGHLQFICNLKENYTQRIANSAFSFANRVGITFAKLSSKTDNKNDEEPKVASKSIQMNYDDEDALIEQGAITQGDTN